MKKSLLVVATASSMAMGLAQQSYEVGIPNNSAYTYLKDYKPLKQYVDREKYPNFRTALAVEAWDYLNNSTVRNVVNQYFHETVAGNSMKMASCVNNQGNMDFGTVTNFVNTATNAGVQVYGHTLAWHSQQPVGWLRSLIKDKPAEDLKTGDVKVSVLVFNKDFRTQQNVGWTADKSQFGFSLNFNGTDGLNIHTTKICKNSYDVQFLGATDIPLVKGKTYTLKMMVKGTKAGNLHSKLGDWSSGPGAEIPFTTEWKEVQVKYANVIGPSFLMLQCGDFLGDIYIRNVSIEEEKWAIKKVEDRRHLKFHATQRQSQTYDNQFWLYLGSFSANSKFTFSAEVRADKPAIATTQIHTSPGSYVHHQAIGDLNFTTEWKTINLSGTLSNAGQSIAFNISELADSNNYYLDNISFKINGVEKIKNGNLEGTDVSSFYGKVLGGGPVHPTISEGLSYLWMPSSTPLSDKERHDTLVYAMDKWIKGMMNACNGKVKAWDVVNEAISGGGNDGSGNYNLQHGQGYQPGNTTWDVGGDAFYWQDFMGDLEYVRQAVRLARKYGPKDIKLFINDYNLESDWDGNHKLKSLINWIKKWEADGETYIDGIGSQMHISCSMNANTLNSRKNAITNMFKLLAASGKWVRVSEFDMGMDDANGNPVKTANMTEAMHKKMAEHYEWILNQYLTIIPPAQQWGFCQWCATDAPSNSGWRADTPVGLWTQNWNRKHTYAGYAKGLGAVISTGINEVEAESEEPSGIIFDLCGKRQTAAFSELPAGLYIVNGRKVVKK